MPREFLISCCKKKRDETEGVMKTKSVLRKLTAAVLSCTLCCTGMTVPAFSAEETEEEFVFPERIDLRETNPSVLTPVKRQHGNTCWAYSAIGAIESDMIKKGLADSSVDLSEAHLIWFIRGQGSPTDPDDPCYGGGKSYGTDAYDMGGSVLEVMLSLGGWQGVVNQTDCSADSEELPLDESLRYQSIAHLQNMELVVVKDTERMKKMFLEKGGPLRGTYYHIYKLSLSENAGYYNADYANGGTIEKGDGGNHGILIVGWDDHYPKENFNQEAPADGAWICKNSWGNYKNSEDGYFYLSYYEATIREFGYLDMQPVTNFGNVYHYNNCSKIKHKYPGEDYGYVTATVFEAKKDEKVAAVGFLTDRLSQDYEISVYALNPDCTDPQDGTLVTTFGGTEAYPGFHTEYLPESYAVKKGQKYSVLVKSPIGKDYGFYYDDCCYQKGISFYADHYAETGENEKLKWKDCYDKNYGDICTYVYTEYEGDTEQFIRGDLNRDGRVNAIDLSLLKQVLLGRERTDIDRKAADWNGDETISAEDAAGILDFLLQKEA